jgi:phosphatidylinositol-3-phosphatase
VRTIVAAAVLAVLALAGGRANAAPAATCGGLATRTPPPRVAHVVWVWMENHSYSAIVGSSSAPYLTGLAARCGLATSYSAVTHPSLTNYVAATSGSTQGVADDDPPSSHPLSVPSIFGQVASASYEESMPSNCALADASPYAVKHNPEAYYLPVRAACRRNDVPLESFDATKLPAFSFVTPNLCNDMHDCSVSTGDRWLRSFLPKLTASRDYRAGRTVVFVTWDEDDRASGNHVATIVLSAYTPSGTRSAKRFDHYSLLRTSEELLGAALLGNAAHAGSMRAAFHL